MDETSLAAALAPYAPGYCEALRGSPLYQDWENSILKTSVEDYRSRTRANNATERNPPENINERISQPSELARLCLLAVRGLSVLRAFEEALTYMNILQRTYEANSAVQHQTTSSSRVRRVLPMYISKNLDVKKSSDINKSAACRTRLLGGPKDEKYFEAIADTGSDENAMDWETFKTLGWQLTKGKNARREFVLANGRSFRSMGYADVPCAFADRYTKILGRFGEKGHMVRFNIFSRLAAPIVFGKAFLDDTETLTKYQYRLEEKDELDDEILRVMHFNRPSSRIRCSLDGVPVFANADTGAEMNLVRPSFATKIGRSRHHLTKEDLYIQLADGSSERITASFEGMFTLDGYEGQTHRQAKFYILPGLTSEALVGEETLYEMDVFQHYLDAFVDIFNDDEHISLNIIKWLTGNEARLIHALGRRSAANPGGGTGSGNSGGDAGGTTASSHLPDAALDAGLFRSALNEADARELHRREQAELRITSLRYCQKRCSRRRARSNYKIRR